MFVVSVSKLVNLTNFNTCKLVSEAAILANLSTSWHIIYPHNGLGNPKIPDEIAGIETDSHFNSLALIKVFLIHSLNRSGSPLLPLNILFSYFAYI